MLLGAHSGGSTEGTLVPTLVPTPPSPTVTQHHLPSPFLCCKVLIGHGGRCRTLKAVELKIRVSVVKSTPGHHSALFKSVSAFEPILNLESARKDFPKADIRTRCR